ncbi:MAG: hypothetical protein HY911_03080 [Desulfobacterales bacterium]|nr:hypothetical protein [Desulfobacterales bacterium]
MKRPILHVAALTAALLLGWLAPASANMATYSAEPVFISKSVPPNIMIILDNSGSMNFNAYGSYPGNGGTVNDEPFEGEGRSNVHSFLMQSNADDMEETAGGGDVWDGLGASEGDLDMGEALTGLRFQNVQVPQGATIVSASIRFIADENGAAASTLTIDAEASDDAPAMNASLNNNISGRTGTAAQVTWSPQAWTAGDPYSTDDISTIVQELVSRAGWASGNDMLFRIAGTGKRAAEAREVGSQYGAVLRIAYDDGGQAKRRYYGYFSPDYFYSYSGNAFRYAYKKDTFNATTSTWSVEDLNGATTTLTAANIVSQQLWDGNWLNWLSMRRIDVLRKVLLGGDTQGGRDGSGNQMLYGENNGDRWWYKNFDSTACAVSPYLGSFNYRVRYDYITVSNTNYYIRVEKQIAREPSAFFNYDNGDNLAGVLQKVGDQNVRWGNTWFRLGTGNGENGGYVDRVMGTDMVTLVSSMEGKTADTWTPLAETFYVAMQYFRQELPSPAASFYASAVPNAVKGDSDDPYYQNGLSMRCAKSFVLLLTDGASTMDGVIPSTLKNYYSATGDNTGCTESNGNNCELPDSGTRYLDDVAYYAHINDLRADLDDEQNLTLYAVYAFGNDPNARDLLREAAKNGGFDDKNNNDTPEPDEYDENGDSIPDNYFEAGDGYLLEARLMDAFLDIGQKAASGTSASVLATNSEGEGNMIQAYFVAAKENEQRTEKARWLGYLQSLWMDSNGRLRDDSGDVNATLDDNDAVVEFITNAEGDTKVLIEGQELDLDSLHPIFQSDRRLEQRVPATRKIFTFVDLDRDGVADESTADPFDTTGEVIAFDSASAARIKPFLGVADNTLYGSLGMNLGATHDTRVTNIIEWVRGTEITGLRNRTVDGVTHRLGDIIHSTPVTVSKAVDNYHTLYADQSYLTYWNAVKGRESLIYVGANDGMLHAFTSWNYGFDTQGRSTYTKPAAASANERIGDEVWAFIPQAVLPHLKWPAHENYTHTYLVDGRPRVFDAKILPDDTHYTDSDAEPNWGTFLVMGLRMGAKHITVTENFGTGAETRAFDPTYFCLDITDPRNPRLMWERTYPNLAMSWSRPAPLKVGERWYLAFGSGPTDYSGTSNQPGYLYVADLATGNLLRQFGPIETAASLGFFNDPVTFDKNLNYNVDAIYTTGSFLTGGAWQGGVYKIAVPCDNCQWDDSYNPNNAFGYAEDPAQWIYHKLFASDRPITAPLSVSSEYSPSINIDNVWLYFGTGRYLTKTDVSNSDQQYLYGIKDPYFNSRAGAAYHDYTDNTVLDRSDLMRVDTLTVTTQRHVLQGGTVVFNDFDLLETHLQENYSGWYRNLEDTGTGPSERIVSKPSLLGGMLFVPVFTPGEDLCDYGGMTNVLALYYATGTGYYRQIFDCDTPDTILVNGNTEDVVAVKLTEGFIGSPPPMAGMHAGQEKGARAFMQQSSGRILELDVNPPFYFQGAIIDWWD